MKKIAILMLALATFTATTGCKKKTDPVTPPAEVKTINFTANIFQFTKATDTSFEEGDAISVNIFNPEVYLHNAKFTYTEGKLKANSLYEWYEDETIESTITAFYPSSVVPQEVAETISFTVNADQSTKAGYSSSDLLVAITKSKPTASAVALPFKHALSKIVINVDNKIGEDIANVWFTDIYGSVNMETINPAEATTTGSKGTIKAYKNGENTWQLIVAPQTEVSPKLALTTASGKQYTFTLSENVSFAAGKVSTATIEVTKETISTSFTPEISDWVADNDLNFSQDDSEENIPVLPEPEFCKLIIKVNKDIDWYDKYIYAWDENETKLCGEWPGTKTGWVGKDGDYYVYFHEFDVSLAGTKINYIINNGYLEGTSQTNDLSVTLNAGETTVIIEASDKK